MIYQFMEAEKADFPIRFMAEHLKVSTSGFYDWRNRQGTPSERSAADARLTEAIVAIHTRSRGTYGSPRIWAELRLGLGIRVGRKRVERLMRHAGIAGVSRRRRGYGRKRRSAGRISADLVDRQFDTDRPDRLWAADITEHPTGGGTVYLAVVMDAWNREIIGWSIADHIRAELVCDAFGDGPLAAPSPTRHGAEFTTPTTEVSTHPGRLGRNCAERAFLKSKGQHRRRPATTRWWNRSSPPPGPSCWTDSSGKPANSCQQPSSSTSKAGTTPKGDTPTTTTKAL